MRLRTKIIGLPLVLSTLSLIILAGTRSQLPSDAKLQTRFLNHRADFEKVTMMANEDSHLTRIAPDFTWLDEDVAWPRKSIGISEQRWNDYKQLFQSIGASQGISNYRNPALILIPITSEGSVPSGVEKGLAYSPTPLSPALKSLDEAPPQQYWNGPDHSHLLVYKPIENHWYIYLRQW